MPLEHDGQPWAVRAARNEALFRAINDELGAQGGSDDPRTLMIACECADIACVATLEIDCERYAQVRQKAARFIVRPEHVYPEVEQVVLAEDGGFVVVEKTGVAGRVAAASD